MWILIGVVLVSCFASIFSVYITQLSDEYGTPYDNETLSSYDKMTDINNNIMAIKGNTSTFEEKTSETDRIGNFFGAAYSVLISIPKSLDLVVDLTDTAVEDTGLQEGGEVIKITLISILTILIFVGVILAILLKTDRI